jgi:hypothetical protein
MVERAAELGALQGVAGASWVSLDEVQAAHAIQCIEDGDPEWWDFYGPTSAPLSGEWADGMTTIDLCREVGCPEHWGEPGESWGDIAEQSAVADAYEEAYYQAWEEEVLRMAHYQVDGVQS